MHSVSDDETPLRVTIAASHRFHLNDLARELLQEGMDVQFISYVPREKAAYYGVPPEAQSSMLMVMLPILAWNRFLPRVLPRTRKRLNARMINWTAARLIKECDVFICLSGLYVEAAKVAKERFGAQVWLERGSTHIMAQHRILSDIQGATIPSAQDLAREKAGYLLADRIVVASEHVVESFRLESPSYSAKIIKIPYGANLSEFPLMPRQALGSVCRILMVGGWSLRKGCDVLIEAISEMSGVHLTHVGSIQDCDFPDGHPSFQHFDPVPQSQLAVFYRNAHLAVLPSREEGLAMVQMQSLSCGLPLVGTTMSGARDLALSDRLARNIFVCSPGDAEELRNAIAAAIDALRSSTAPALTEEDRLLLGWKRYGRDYAAQLRRIVKRSR